MMSSFFRIALLFLLSGCVDSRPDARSNGSPADTAAADSASESAEAASDSGAVLALEGEGLRVFSTPSGVARPIPFGTPMAATLDVLSRVEQSPPREQGENIECRAAYATWENGLTVWFDRDRFVGWSVRSGNNTLTTASGVGIGSTRSELEASYVVQVIPSSLGEEFTAGGIAGLLDSARPDARVTNLWAGQTCIAR